MKKLPGVRTAAGGALFYLLLSLLVSPVVFGTLRSNDLWKALYSGRYLAEFARFPHHSTFTFSPVVGGLPRDAFTWLGNLVLYGLYRGIGEVGPQGFRVFLVVLVVLLVHGYVRYKRSVFTLLALALMVYGLHQKLLVRTALFALPGVTLLLWLWFHAVEEGRARFLWFIPLLMVVWSNLHGSYLVGLGFLAVLVTGGALHARVGRSGPAPGLGRCLAVLLVSVFLCVLVKPFPDTTGAVRLAGWADVLRASPEPAGDGPIPANGPGPLYARAPGQTDGFGFLRSLLNNALFGRDRAFRSAEFAFPLDRPGVLFVTVNLLLAGVGLASLAIRPGAQRPESILLVLAAVVLGLGYLRTLAYVSLVVVPVLMVRARRGEFRGLIRGCVPRWAARAAVGLLIGLVLVQGLWRSGGHFTGVRMHRLGPGRAPRLSEGVPEYLRERGGPRAFNHYNLGSFLVWRWWPDRRVYLDTKSSAYRDSFLREYARTPVPRLVDRADLNALVLPLPSSWNYAYYIPREDWTVAGFDAGMIAYRRTEGPRDVRPLEVLRMDAGSVSALPVSSRRTLRQLIRFINTFQNNTPVHP